MINHIIHKNIKSFFVFISVVYLSKHNQSHNHEILLGAKAKEKVSFVLSNSIQIIMQNFSFMFSKRQIIKSDDKCHVIDYWKLDIE